MEIELRASRRREEGRAEGNPGRRDHGDSWSVTSVVLPPRQQQQVHSANMLKEWVSHTAHLTPNTEITEAWILSPWYLVLIRGLAGLLMWGLRKPGCWGRVGSHRNYSQNVVFFQSLITEQAAEWMQTCSQTHKETACVWIMDAQELKNFLHVIFEATA